MTAVPRKPWFACLRFWLALVILAHAMPAQAALDDAACRRLQAAGGQPVEVDLAAA